MNPYLEELSEYYESNHNNAFFYITGDRGLGKTYIIKEFLKDKKHVLHIQKPIDPAYYLDSVIEALDQYSNGSFLHIGQTLNTPDAVKRSLLQVCRKEDTILFFESLNTYDANLFEFCLAFFRTITDDTSLNRSSVIIELDSDYAEQNNDSIAKLYSLTCDTYFINIKKRKSEDLETILFQKFNNKLTIDKSSLKYIIDSAFGNVMRMIIILNYLKQEKYIILKDGQWICSDLPTSSLNHNITDYVLERYNKLDTDLKEVLHKSSFLGIEFNVTLLQNSFNLCKAEQELSRIEKISCLIRKIDNNHYFFDTPEVHEIIHELIPGEEKKKGYKILADYYELQIIKITDNIEAFRLYCKLSFCFKNCENLEKAIAYHFEAIRMGMVLMDYEQVLKLLQSLKSMIQLLEEYGFVYYEANRWETYCYRELGKYSKALEIYPKLLHYKLLTFDELVELEILYANTLYYVGKVGDSKKILLDLELKLQKKNKRHLLFRVFSELATVFGFFREYDIAGDYFSRSLNIAKDAGLEHEYYIQIRKATMLWDENVSKPYLLEAYDYFENKEDMKELSRTAHNIGTDSMYIGDTEAAEKYLEIAKNNFIEYGSTEIHYTYNCIGVYYAAFANDYKKALTFFENALSYDPVPFSQMVLRINMSSSYCAMGEPGKAFEMLDIAKTIQKQLGDEIPSYKIYILINEGLYYKQIHNYEKSLYFFYESLKYKLKNDQLYLVSKNIEELEAHPADHVLQLTHITASSLYRNFCSNNLCLSTLRFWE